MSPALQTTWWATVRGVSSQLNKQWEERIIRCSSGSKMSKTLWFSLPCLPQLFLRKWHGVCIDQSRMLRHKFTSCSFIIPLCHLHNKGIKIHQHKYIVSGTYFCNMFQTQRAISGLKYYYKANWYNAIVCNPVMCCLIVF